MFSRREWLLSSAAFSGAAGYQAGGRDIVIASSNGLSACQRAMDILRSGGDTLEAVVEGVTLVELDPGD
ncbi:MAG: glycosylasparaginase, partial [Bryobacteraceae bacterium]|nr:glycosylasparaginase [Bryobacteraceae bacterium]